MCNFFSVFINTYAESVSHDRKDNDLYNQKELDEKKTHVDFVSIDDFFFFFSFELEFCYDFV